MKFIPINSKLLFIFAIFLILLFIVTIFFVFGAKKENEQLLHPSSTPLSYARQPYEVDKLDKDSQRISQTAPLSDNDKAIRQQLINGLNNQSGILYEDSNMRIEYVKAPNLFMAEIKSNNPDETKIEITRWFNQQGVSDSGICNLPVMINLSFETSQYLKQNGKEFDPIPIGCQ